MAITYNHAQSGVVIDALLELFLWITRVRCSTVLILDNCDDVLSSKVRYDFIDLVTFLLQNSNHFVHIIIVAQSKLLMFDNFAHWTVKELSTEHSVHLLQKLAPGVPASQAELISNLVERCPLALKVVGSLLHLNGGDLLTKKLEVELNDDPIGVLDHPDDRDHQFRVIMELALSRFHEMMDDKCDFSVSLFPGTFSWEAGHNILPQPSLCLDAFVKYSLLDEYVHGYIHRYRMHRLIKKFLLEKVSINQTKQFKDRFSYYFESFIVMYIAGGLHEVDEIDEYALNLEKQNTQYCLDLLLSQEDPLTPKQLATLSYGFTDGLIPFVSLEPLFIAFMRNMTDVCSFVDSDPHLCGRLYSEIIQRLFSECTCKNMSSYLANLMSGQCPCTSTVADGIFQCHTVHDINNTESIWILLPVPIQGYIERVMRYNCYHSHVFAFNFFSMLSMLVLSVSMRLTRKWHKIVVTATIYVVSAFYTVHKYIDDDGNKIVPLQVFLKMMCHGSLFLLFLLMLLFVVHTTFQLTLVSITLVIMYFVMTYLWDGTTYPLQGCDFLPLCS